MLGNLSPLRTNRAPSCNLATLCRVLFGCPIALLPVGKHLALEAKSLFYLKDAHAVIPIKAHHLFLLLMEFEHCSSLTCATPYRVPSVGKPAVQSDKHCQGHSNSGLWQTTEARLLWRSRGDLESPWRAGLRSVTWTCCAPCDLRLLHDNKQ